ncbi:MAG TPA: MBL fold metallo-hydrolase [Vicinamibacterales bacterium]|jgi:glyoxylase-like metal-dependent hydrolase (beta-lactamase superfamily II)
MKRVALAITIGVLALVAAAAQSRRPVGTTHTGDAFRFNKVKEGIYHAVGTGALAVVGNSSFIVNDNDVIVVDDHVSPAAAWVLLEEIKKVTPKPVTTVINTHFHFDHAHGNQIFDPAVQIIGHEFTRRMLLNNSIGMPLYQNYVTGLPTQIEGLKKQIASAADPAAKAKLQAQLQATENNLASQKELKPTPPNVTLTTQMTLYRGKREIQIRYLGRGHTAGDIVVYLPNEKVVMTGDFLTAALSNMSDSFPNEWADSLDALKKLDFDTVLPGHGEAFTDKAKIDYFQAYLRDVWSEVSKLKQQGVSAEEASKRADLTKHKDHLPIQGPGVPLIGVQRIYTLLDGKS